MSIQKVDATISYKTEQSSKEKKEDCIKAAIGIIALAGFYFGGVIAMFTCGVKYQEPSLIAGGATGLFGGIFGAFLIAGAFDKAKTEEG